MYGKAGVAAANYSRDRLSTSSPLTAAACKPQPCCSHAHAIASRHPHIRSCITRVGRRDLASSEEVLGEKHPDTLISVNNLALLLKNKGDYDGAEPLLRCVQ